MKNNQLKNIGTVSLQEIKNITSYVPWENLVRKDIPISALGTPDGYIHTQGSACGSLATTSIQGWNYVADFYLYRKDGSVVDRDRYLGSITPKNTLAILLVPKNQTSYHHVDLTNLSLVSLPAVNQAEIRDLLQTKE